MSVYEKASQDMILIMHYNVPQLELGVLTDSRSWEYAPGNTLEARGVSCQGLLGYVLILDHSASSFI